jgi:uncharacterized protein (DUF362 family)
VLKPACAYIFALSTLACGSPEQAGEQSLVALTQSSRGQAAELTLEDVTALVTDAVNQGGGLDFIQDGSTVVLKPSLITFYEDAGEHTAATTTNGIATDWRVVKVVADLVRAKNPSGKILVMEGSRVLAFAVFPVLGYTPENFGTAVDEFVGIEGSSCADSSTEGLEQRTAPSGKPYWVNARYRNADVIISIPTLGTSSFSGVGGAVESMGIGGTPAGQYGDSTNSVDCTRTKIPQSTPTELGSFIVDYFSLRPADFVVMDGLQGLQHGPLPVWDDSGTYSYAESVMNMRLILAGSNAVAVDSVAARVMKCFPEKVPHLSGLAALGIGRINAASIRVVGTPIAQVARSFAGKYLDICPGG